MLVGRFDIGQFLQESNPYAWGATGIGLCIGLSVLGAGWCVASSPIMPEMRLTRLQGNIPHRFIHYWRWCQVAANHNKELD